MLYEGSLTAAEKSAKDMQNKEQGKKENAKTRAILQGIEESNKLYNEAMERATEEEATDLAKNMTRAMQADLKKYPNLADDIRNIYSGVQTKKYGGMVKPRPARDF